MEKRANIEMFTSLWHDRFIGGDDKHDEIDSTDSGKHVLDEALMARNVNKTNGGIGINREVREPQVDRDASFFFFFEAIGVDPGERLYERGFAMVDVSSSTYNNVRHNN